MSTSSKLVIVGVTIFVILVLALGGDAAFFADLMKILTAFSPVPQ